jgi:hypothetical protein
MKPRFNTRLSIINNVKPGITIKVYMKSMINASDKIIVPIIKP